LGSPLLSKTHPVLLAAQNGDVATVEKFLKAGAKVDGDALSDNQELADPSIMAQSISYAVEN
jgi:ankyrin repeat protein